MMQGEILSFNRQQKRLRNKLGMCRENRFSKARNILLNKETRGQRRDCMEDRNWKWNADCNRRKRKMFGDAEAGCQYDVFTFLSTSYQTNGSKWPAQTGGKWETSHSEICTSLPCHFTCSFEVYHTAPVHLFITGLFFFLHLMIQLTWLFSFSLCHKLSFLKHILI